MSKSEIWAQWKEDWKSSRLIAWQLTNVMYLNEKRIESYSPKPRKTATSLQAQWKEDWKLLTIQGCTHFILIPQWKEDWKITMKRGVWYHSAISSMKRGLKDNLPKPLNYPILLTLNEKRIERYGRAIYAMYKTLLTQWKEDWKLGTLTIFSCPYLSLNEKRIESLLEKWKLHSCRLLAQWKEDWKCNANIYWTK